MLSLNYRKGVGYGRAFRRCEGSRRRCGWEGATEYEDVKRARIWMDDSLAPSAVAVHGLSYGGLNCLQALSRDSPSYVAGACSAPVFNWVSAMGHSQPFRADGFETAGGFRQLPVGPEPDLAGPSYAKSAEANLAGAWLSSPAAFMANFSAPLLLLHGDADANVYVQESRGVLRALRRRKGGERNVVETFVLPDETHGFATHEHQVLAAEATYDFLARYLPLHSRP